MIEYINSPIFVSERYDISYTFNEVEGLREIHKSRRALRARSVLAMAYMRSNIGYSISHNLLFYGERRASRDAARENADKIEQFTALNVARDMEHAGYYVLPRDEDAGWATYCGYAVAFLEDKSVEHVLFEMYHMVRHSINFLNRNPDIISNILSARYAWQSTSSSKC